MPLQYEEASGLLALSCKSFPIILSKWGILPCSFFGSPFIFWVLSLHVLVNLTGQSCLWHCCMVSIPWCYIWSSELHMQYKLKFPSRLFPCHINNLSTFSLTIWLPESFQMHFEDCSEHTCLLILTETWCFLFRQGVPGMSLITETTELWVSISNNPVCFHFFCAGSGLVQPTKH